MCRPIQRSIQNKKSQIQVLEGLNLRVAQRDEESEESRLMGNVYRSRRGIQADLIGWTGGKIRAFQSPER